MRRRIVSAVVLLLFLISFTSMALAINTGGQTIVKETATPKPTRTPRPTPAPGEKTTPTPSPTPTPKPTPTPQPTLAPVENTADLLTVTLTGHIGLGDSTRWNSQARSLTAVQAPQADSWLFEELAPVFLNDDLTLGVLSMPMCEQDQYTPILSAPMVAPPDAVRFLTEGGIDAVCLATQRLGDYGAAGYQRTQAVLEEAGIPHFGTYRTRQGESFDELLIWKVKDVRIGVVGYSSPSESMLPEILERVQLLREHACDLVIVSLEWASTDATMVTGEQSGLAEALVAEGVDIVWGHGSNELLPAFWCAGKPVIMSAGTLCDGYSGAVGTFGCCFTLTYDISGGTPSLRGIRAIPIKTGNRGEYRPFCLFIDKNRQSVLSKLIASKDRGHLMALPRDFAASGELTVDPEGRISAVK